MNAKPIVLIRIPKSWVQDNKEYSRITDGWRKMMYDYHCIFTRELTLEEIKIQVYSPDPAEKINLGQIQEIKKKFKIF